MPSPEGVDNGPGTSFPALLAHRAATRPAAVAHLEKRLGLWRPVTWREHADDVAALAHAMHSLGIGAGDTVALMAKPCSQWLVLDLAAQSIGAVPVGVHTTAGPADLRQVLDAAAPKLLVIETEEHFDRYLEAAGSDRDGPGRPVLVSLGEELLSIERYDDLRANGAARHAADPAAWQGWLAERGPDDLAAGFVSAGTTGPPVVAVHTAASLLQAWRDMADHLGLGSRGRERVVASQSLASALGRGLAGYLPLLVESTTFLPEAEHTAIQASREARPTIVFLTPARLATFQARVDEGLSRSGLVRRAVAGAAFALRARSVPQPGRRAGVAARAAGGLGHVLACRQILDRFGLVAARVALTGGLPVADEVVRRWRSRGLRVRSVYTLAEAAVAGVQPAEGALDGGYEPLPGVEVRLTDRGEIEVRGSGVCAGFLDGGAVRPIGADGWVRTGDLGEMTGDRRVRVVDRVGHVLTVGGRQVPPAQVELVLAEQPHVRRAHVVEGRPGTLVALVELDVDVVNARLLADGRLAMPPAELAADPEVLALLAADVRAANEQLEELGLPAVEAQRIVPRTLDPEDDDVTTSTGSIRRGALETVFQHLMAELREEEVDVR